MRSSTTEPSPNGDTVMRSGSSTSEPTLAGAGSAPRPISDAAYTPTPRPTPCAVTTHLSLRHAWRDIELGCPIGQGQDNLSTAYAPFAGGQMLWRGDTGAIYVLYNDGRWERYDDRWREGDPDYTCGEAATPPTPRRGFGRVWCDDEAVRAALGAVTADEIGDSAGSVQEFVNGTLILSPDGSTFVLVGETGTWRRVLPGE